MLLKYFGEPKGVFPNNTGEPQGGAVKNTLVSLKGVLLKIIW